MPTVEAAHAMIDLGCSHTQFESTDQHEKSLLLFCESDSGCFPQVDDDCQLSGEPSSNLELEISTSFPSPLMSTMTSNIDVESLSSGFGFDHTQKGQMSRMSVALYALKILYHAKINATELLNLAANGSHPEFTLYHSAFYVTTNENHICQLLDSIQANPKGSILIRNWMRSHAVELVCDTIHTDMEATTP